jgi:hypothetical protein
MIKEALQWCKEQANPVRETFFEKNYVWNQQHQRYELIEPPRRGRLCFDV